MNILDYIDWRGDITFEEKGLNEVDNLIFSTLAYLVLDGMVPDDGAGISLGDLCAAYTEAGIDQSYLVNDPLPLLKKAAPSDRFSGVFVKWYERKTDTEKQVQFAAVTFEYAPEKYYIAFRGTDNTIVGWREDCNLSFLSSTPGQNEAAEYVNKIAERTKGDLTVGGHSKGGNFAVYAASFCDETVKRERIRKVYSNDGPGFNEKTAASPEYTSILDKTEKIIPDSSLVGILLSSREKRRIIKSSARGVMQHNPYTWNVVGPAFEEADERTTSSVFMDEALSKWVSTLDDENKRILVDSVFDSLESTGASTFHEISTQKRTYYNAIIKALTKIEPESRSGIKSSLSKLFSAGREVLVSETVKRLEKDGAKNG